MLDSLLNKLLTNPKVKQNGRDQYHAKKLAKELEIDLTVEKDYIGWGCWIEYHVEQVGPKGWKDDLFCRDWFEVRERLATIKGERSNEQ